MSELLKQKFEKTIGAPVTEVQFESFLNLMFVKHYDKKDFLVEKGHTNNYIYFVLSGSCYSYMEEDNGDISVVQFALEGNWISDLYSFFSGKNAIYNVQALEAMEVLAINNENFELACDRNALFDKYFRIIIQNAYVALQYRVAKSNIAEADERYYEFAKQYPSVVQRIPQYLIASYLGIKPQSLSRIRNVNTKGK